MATSGIEWTEATWNPVAGCTVVSPGCTNCYAMRMAARIEAMGHEKYSGTTRRSGGRAVWTGAVNAHVPTLTTPLGWRTSRRVFVNSMSDLFHDGVPTAFIQEVWKVMAQANHHTYQILTKRPERMQSLVTSEKLPTLPNVWLGTSVETSDYIERIDHLRATPAAIRFVSFEPLLGPIKGANLGKIDWAIVGGESGPGARQMDHEWVESLQRQCARSGVAFFFKQWGGTNKKKSGRTLQGRTWDEYPASASHTG